ncbi:MAG: threonine synthase, partial [Ruminococcus sp.]|nr:threonine synthase [Ruminococcus sp.]
FINTGVYDKNRDFYTTVSPSMDILVSSNLERLLYTMSGDNDAETKGYMDALKAEGKYEVSDSIKEKISAMFYGGYADEDATEKTIHDLYEQQHYLCDTHTAVAVAVCDEYIKKTGDKTPVVIASTASPYKFSKAVLSAINTEKLPESEFDMVEKLNELTDAPVPAPLASLRGKTARFSDVTDKEDMQSVVLGALGISK